MFKLIRIRGRSLQPELQDGDVVLSFTIRRLWRLGPGALVLFRQPPYGLLVKKVDHLLPDGRLFVVGTAATSVDSYEFGPISPAQVEGVVIRVFRK